MTENAESTKKGPDLGDLKVYEVGYFLVPLIAESDVGNEVGKIQLAIETHGGVSISDEFPALRSLAYEMRKAMGEKNQVFSNGYFGWIKKDFDLLPNILRFILVRTVRENTFFAPKSPMLSVKQPGSIEEGGVREVETSTISDEELDKSIEQLIAE
jgi:ribosomal protein S6